MEVTKSGQSIELTSAEFKILEALCSQAGKVVSRENLMLKALGYRDFLNDRTLDTHIKNIRKKIEDDPKKPEFIKTVRESGFKFVIPPL
jgi:DNA-binding response OmpR family regulator